MFTLAGTDVISELVEENCTIFSTIFLLFLFSIIRNFYKIKGKYTSVNTSSSML